MLDNIKRDIWPDTLGNRFIANLREKQKGDTGYFNTDEFEDMFDDLLNVLARCYEHLNDPKHYVQHKIYLDLFNRDEELAKKYIPDFMLNCNLR